MDRRRRRSEVQAARRTQPDDASPTPDPGQPTVYRIKVKGHLEDDWADWHANLTVTREQGGDTLLTLPVMDQAALHGLLRKLRDLGVPLVSINPAGPEQSTSSCKEEKQ